MKEVGILMKPEMVNATLEDIKNQTRRPITFHNSTTGGIVKKKEWHELRWDEAWLDVNGPSPAGNPGPYWHVPFRDIVVRVYPRVQPGDVLWVKETFWVDRRDPEECVIYAQDPRYYMYPKKGIVERCHIRDTKTMLQDSWVSLENAKKAVEDNNNWYKKPSIFMPRWASRIDLDVLKVRSDRIQEISEEDSKAEGIEREHAWDGTPGFGYDMGMWYRDYSSAASSCKIQCPITSFRTLWDSINADTGFSWEKNHPVWIYDFKRK
jgi:hypothetical protein